MVKGSLLQYRETCYGRYYSQLPKIPFAPGHQFLSSNHQGSYDNFELWRTGQITKDQFVGRKKYNLICTGSAVVAHPRFPTITCTYLKCFISDPYANGYTTDGWVQEQWVEPLNELATYQEEHKVVREVYQNMPSTKEPPRFSLQEVYQKIQVRRK